MAPVLKSNLLVQFFDHPTEYAGINLFWHPNPDDEIYETKLKKIMDLRGVPEFNDTSLNLCLPIPKTQSHLKARKMFAKYEIKVEWLPFRFIEQTIPGESSAELKKRRSEEGRNLKILIKTLTEENRIVKVNQLRENFENKTKTKVITNPRSNVWSVQPMNG